MVNEETAPTPAATRQPVQSEPGARVARERRVRTVEEKKSIVAEAIKADSAADVARKHNLQPNLLYRWMAAMGDAVRAQGVQPEMAKPEPDELQRLREENMRLKAKLYDIEHAND